MFYLVYFTFTNTKEETSFVFAVQIWECSCLSRVILGKKVDKLIYQNVERSFKLNHHLPTSRHGLQHDYTSQMRKRSGH